MLRLLIAKSFKASYSMYFFRRILFRFDERVTFVKRKYNHDHLLGKRCVIKGVEAALDFFPNLLKKIYTLHRIIGQYMRFERIFFPIWAHVILITLDFSISVNTTRFCNPALMGTK